MPANNTAKRFRVSAVALTLALAANANARDCDVAVAEQVTIASVAGGGTLVLADGRRARLAAIDLIDGAALANWAGKTVALAYTDKGTDRRGNLVAHAFVDGTWAQGALVETGRARVRTRSDMRRCAAELLAREAEARKAKRGLWTDPLYRVRKPGDLHGDIGTFQIVEGKVLAVARSRGRAFLNFGQDRHTDFTVTIAPSPLRRMTKEGIDPAAWAGKTIRVRGWLALLNGPELEVTHAEQIELLD